MIRNDSTSVLLTWTPPSPLGDTTGYRISFTGGSSGSVNVSGGSTDNFTLTRLRSGEMYNISIVGTSEHFFSESVAWNPVVLQGNNGTNSAIETTIVNETTVSDGEEEKDSGGGAVMMNDGDNTGAIIAGMVTPFILLVTVFAVILVCWRWYAHCRCYIFLLKTFPTGGTSSPQAQVLLSLQPLVSQCMCIYEVLSKAKANNSTTLRTTMKERATLGGI